MPAKKPELSQRQKNARMAFNRAHVGWNNPQWRRVMFPDEVSEASGWQETSPETTQRERHVPATVIPTIAFQGCGVMVWAGISATANTELVFIKGNLNANVTLTKSLRHMYCRLIARCQSPIQFSRMTTPSLIERALLMTNCVRTT